MSINVNDPEALENFARKLQRGARELREGLRRLQTDLAYLGEQWRDPNYQRFAKDLNEVIKPVDKTLARAEEFCPDLRKRAQLLRDFERGR